MDYVKQLAVQLFSSLLFSTSCSPSTLSCLPLFLSRCHLSLVIRTIGGLYLSIASLGRNGCINLENWPFEKRELSMWEGLVKGGCEDTYATCLMGKHLSRSCLYAAFLSHVCTNTHMLMITRCYIFLKRLCSVGYLSGEMSVKVNVKVWIMSSYHLSLGDKNERCNFCFLSCSRSTTIIFFRLQYELSIIFNGGSCVCMRVLMSFRHEGEPQYI